MKIKVLLLAIISALVIGFSDNAYVRADTIKDDDAATTLDSTDPGQAEDLINNHTKLVNNQYVLVLPKSKKYTQSTIRKVQLLLQAFNRKVNNNNISIVYENDVFDYPFVSFARTKRSRVVWEAANGYCYRDKHGRYHYVVTRTPFQTVMHVMGHGWANAVAGGFGLKH